MKISESTLILQAEYIQGNTVKEISQKYSVSKSVIYRALHGQHVSDKTLHKLLNFIREADVKDTSQMYNHAAYLKDRSKKLTWNKIKNLHNNPTARERMEKKIEKQVEQFRKKREFFKQNGLQFTTLSDSFNMLAANESLDRAERDEFLHD